MSKRRKFNEAFTKDRDLNIEEDKQATKSKLKRPKLKDQDIGKFHQSVSQKEGTLRHEDIHCGAFLKSKEKASDEVPWCNQSSGIKMNLPESLQKQIIVTKFGVKFEGEMRITEEETFIQYKSPKFRVTATVLMAPLPSKQKWKFGFVQACTGSTVDQIFGDKEVDSWVIPEFEKQIMVSDSTGNYYPWINNDTVELEGPSPLYQYADLKASDTLFACNIWYRPQINPSDPEPPLTKLRRKNKFCVWLIAWCKTTKEAYILKTLRWQMDIVVDVDTTKPVGQRTTAFCVPLSEECQNVPVPRCAIIPPCCNHAVTLIRTTRDGKRLCVMPSTWEEMDATKKDSICIKDTNLLCRLQSD